VVRSVTVASTTVELGVPGPHDVPGASRASRSSPSPCPGAVDVVDVADDVEDVDEDVDDVGDVDVEDAGALEGGGVVLVLVAEALGVVTVPEVLEGLADVEEVDDIEVLVELEVVAVVVPGPANPWP
jgi:hypothetical protein